MGATLLDRTTGPQNEQDIAAAGDTRYALDTRILNINGGVEVSQELGLTGATLVNNTAKYVADMWEGFYNHTAATAVVTAGQIAAASFPVALAGFPNAFQIKATTAITAPANGDFALARTKVEGLRAARLGWGAASPASISYGFWFYATASGTISVRVGNAAANRFYWHEHAVVGGIWNWCAFTLPGDATGTWAKDNTVGIEFAIFASGKAAAPAALDAWGATGGTASTNTTNLFGTANNVCIVTGLVILPGTAIPNNLRLFGNMRTYDEEMALCKRYWEASYTPGVAPGAADFSGRVSIWNMTGAVSDVHVNLTFKASKRAIPTMTGYPAAGGASGYASFDNVGQSGGIVYKNLAANTQNSVQWTADARL